MILDENNVFWIISVQIWVQKYYNKILQMLLQNITVKNKIEKQVLDR